MWSSSFFKWNKKLHMYAGLLTFTAFMVWGIIGVYAVFLPGPGNYHPAEISETRAIPFEGPGDLDDRDLARLIFDTIDIPLRGGHYNIRREDDGYLAFYVFTASGRRDVKFIEDESIVRIDVRQNNLFSFLSSMHTAHSNRGPTTTAALMWGYYNEFAVWAFLFMTISGIYMWVETRPGLRWAQWLTTASVASFAVLWLVTR
jgi:hypothetical protein